MIDSGRNAERVTKIIEAPENYDVVVIGDMFVNQLMEAGVIDTFDNSSVSNLSEIYECARAPDGRGLWPGVHDEPSGHCV